MEKYMKIALNEAKKALKKNEIPVGSVIVKNNKVIAKAYNKKEKENCVISHAEINVIKKASKKLKNWRLNGCTIYVTMEPCLMCYSAIIQARIDNIVYGIPNENYGYTNYINQLDKINTYTGICSEECKEIIQTFFKNKRK